MGLKENYETKQMQVETDPEGPVAEEIKHKALEAIYQGVYSEAWVNFMRLFATTEAELARLVGSDGTHQYPKYQKARAMLVASGALGLEKIGDLSGFIEELESDL